MNRRGFLLGLLSSPASAALLPKTLPEIGPPYVAHLENIPFNLYPGAVNYVNISAIQQRLIETFCMPNSLLAGQPLDSRREPWQACDAGDVPVQE